MTAAFGPADDSGESSLTYRWQDIDGMSRLVELRDPVGRGHDHLPLPPGQLHPCPTTAPLGLSPAPLGGPCRIGYVDGSTETKLWFNANGQLARIQLRAPGSARRHFPSFIPKGAPRQRGIHA